MTTQALPYACPRCGDYGRRPGFWGTHTAMGMILMITLMVLLSPVSWIVLCIYLARYMSGRPGPLMWRMRCPSCRNKWKAN